MPRLSLFIQEHIEKILAAWEAFARNQPGAERMDVAALRDHAQLILDFIARDLETPETDEHRDRKSRGLLDAGSDAPPTAASSHGLGRAQRGFSVESNVAEFRALRASVLDLWVKQQKEAGPTELEDMRRFSEAIDQAIAESLAQHVEEIERARDRFLAVPGHDLRTPLTAILASSRFILDADSLSAKEQRSLVAGMERSGHRMSQLVDDLLDVALTRFGDMVPLRRERTDLGALVREVGAEVSAASPAAKIDVETNGTLVGDWDRTRLEQALTNLLSNAVEHGSPGKPIRMTASGDGDRGVAIEVTNEGRAIPHDQIKGVFGAMKGAAKDRVDRRHLGLGLYIVDKVVEAHGGSVDVRSSDEQGTTFRITMPRHAASHA